MRVALRRITSLGEFVRPDEDVTGDPLSHARLAPLNQATSWRA
jgi:hypothetical protein